MEQRERRHLPATLGVGAIRPWLLDGAPLAAAQTVLGIDADRIARDPVAAIVATSYVLRDLAERRHGGLPSSSDPGAWHEVIADYVDLDAPAARASFAEAVIGALRDGVEGDAADGSHVVLAPRAVTIPRTLGLATEYLGAEYSGADWSPASSENYTGGRDGSPIRYIVIHTMQGSYAGSISWFGNPAASVSAHYSIRSSDGAITQSVSEGDTAWHAGNLTYNQQSIGIEHEGFVDDPGRWYTDAMYESSAALVRHLAAKYSIPIDRDHIFGHVEVPGATHTDPGTGWDWDRFMDLVGGTPPAPDYAATYTAQSVPAEMVSGERAVAWLEYRNDGRATWRMDRTRVGTTEPDDHASAFFDPENWINEQRPTGADRGDTGGGAVGRFSFMVTAPDVGEDTTVTDTFRLVEEGVTWFGDAATISVLVHPRTVTAPSDGDGDGSTSDIDCDDASAAVYPGASETCGDGIDQDCDGVDATCAEPGGDAGAPPAGDAGGEDPSPTTYHPHMDGGCAVVARSSPALGSGALALLGLALLVVARRSLSGNRVKRSREARGVTYRPDSIRSLTILSLLASSLLAGCYASAVVDRDSGLRVVDGGERSSDAANVDAVLPDAAALDLSDCESAPLLPLGVTLSGLPVRGLRPPPEGSCGSNISPASPTGYFRMSVPAHTGVAIITRGESPPVASVTNRCAVEPGAECVYFGPHGFFGPGPTERSHYVGNATGEALDLVVDLWWSDSADWVPAPFEIETITSALPDEASCEMAAPLAEGTLAPSGPGGFYDACGWPVNPLFYRISVPPMSRAVALSGSGPLQPIPRCADCAASPGDPFLLTLQNLSPAPRELVVTHAHGVDLAPSVGYRTEPMPPSAACETAPALTLDGPPLTIDMNFAGIPARSCGFFENPSHHVRVTAAAGSTIRLLAQFPDAGPEQGTRLQAVSACDDAICAAEIESSLGATSTELALTAPLDGAQTWIVSVSMTALPAPDQRAELFASSVD